MKYRIKERLDRGERVALECVDCEGFDLLSHANSKILKLSKLVVYSYEVILKTAELRFFLEADESDLDEIGLDYRSAYIEDSELKYFKIKQPTFNDLIEVAKKAVQDDILSSFTVNDMDYSDLIDRAIYIGLGMRAHRIANEIKRIQSLYTETFVIESEEDIEKLCDDAEITLANNEKGIFNNCSGLRSITNLKTGFEVHGLNIFWLKGATVTQEVSK